MKSKPSSLSSSEAAVPRGNCPDQRRRRREKMLDAGDLRLLLLHFLGQGQAHGYELIKAIEALSGGEYSPSSGRVYPALAQLEADQEIAVVDAAAARKAYRLLPGGALVMSRCAEQTQAVCQRLQALKVLVENRRLPEVERAIHNFKTALNGRLSHADLSEQVLHTIVDALDEAAKKIERSR